MSSNTRWDHYFHFAFSNFLGVWRSTGMLYSTINCFFKWYFLYTLLSLFVVVVYALFLIHEITYCRDRVTQALLVRQARRYVICTGTLTVCLCSFILLGGKRCCESNLVLTTHISALFIRQLARVFSQGGILSSTESDQSRVVNTTAHS